jgi:hypothetical protein
MHMRMQTAQSQWQQLQGETTLCTKHKSSSSWYSPNSLQYKLNSTVQRNIKLEALHRLPLLLHQPPQPQLEGLTPRLCWAAG